VGALRVITVLEHEVVPVVSEFEAGRRLGAGDATAWLTESEAVSLLGFNEARPGLCERVGSGVRLAQYCGVLRCGSLVLEVLPKAGMNDARLPEEVGGARAALIGMLNVAGGLRLTAMDDVGQTLVRAPLMEVFVQAFLRCALEQARRGLLFRYLARAGNLTVARGRFDVHAHLRQNLARPHLLHCAYDEFSADNPYNQAVRATLDVCKPWLRTFSGQRLWFEAHARFAEVSAVRMRAGDVAYLRRDRTTRHYGPVLDWCEMLLGLLNPALRSGTDNAPGLMFDMNKLFEAYVLHLEEHVVDAAHVVRAQGPERYLASSGETAVFRLRPDVTLWQRASDSRDTEIVRIVDAKWKRVDPAKTRWGVREEDVYQLLAYAIAYGCKDLQLVYPAPDGLPADAMPPVFTIDAASLAAPVTVRVRTVRLTSPTG
jgi:5-methylcytosine-specific restriction enzyme subunit McrC